jgi:hypothetical protein
VVAPQKGQGETTKDLPSPPRDKMFRASQRKDGET